MLTMGPFLICVKLYNYRVLLLLPQNKIQLLLFQSYNLLICLLVYDNIMELTGQVFSVFSLLQCL